MNEPHLEFNKELADENFVKISKPQLPKNLKHSVDLVLLEQTRREKLDFLDEELYERS